MKAPFFLILLMVVLSAAAQETQKYYDWQWKESDPAQARFVAIIKHTDSGWQRSDYFLGTMKLQMSGLYSDKDTKVANGWFSFYYSNAHTEQEGQNVNNKKHGLWLKFHRNGMLEDSTVYDNNEAVGTSMGWHSNGYMEDSIVWVNGVATKVFWYDNGAVSCAGHSVAGKDTGPWQYFHKNGNMAAMEKYEAGKLTDRQYFDENGKAEKDTASKDRAAEFKGGSRAWQQFIAKHIYYPEQYSLKNADQVTVVVAALIDEDGNVTEPYVDIPFDPRFDDIALEMFKQSPKWKPAISHNRKVKQIIRQPVTFLKPEE